MLLKKGSVEILAPAGTWDALEAAVEAGADAVYLGGKRFNMRMHRTDVNFDDKMLAQAVDFTHKNNVKLYITVNNLISDREIANMKSYLQFLDDIKPDALIVQDLAMLKLAQQMSFSVPLHASVMMNIHNEHAVRMLQEYGLTRIVTNREMTLAQLTLLKERTGIEIEYFIHGDMCIAHSGQCLHSGVVFGQSSNRGRCLKPCRWPYRLIDASTGEQAGEQDPGPYKLALKDMCLYRNLPELIQAGVCSFKIEGRMRTADFVKRIVQVYRRAIDRYIADPTGYTIDETDWQNLYENRSRDFSTCYALGNPGAGGIGYTGEREPRFFSQAVKEASLDTPGAFPQIAATLQNIKDYSPELAVRVADLSSVEAACQHGANMIYIGGEAFKPARPWVINDIRAAILLAAKYDAKLVVTTPRITMEREVGEYEQLFAVIDDLQPTAVMISNISILRLARNSCKLPLIADFSMNVFNHLTVRWLEENGAIKATISPEATYGQLTDLLNATSLPLELIVHGPIEAMVSDHCVPSAVLGNHDMESYDAVSANRQYALLDTAGQAHPIMIDQYGRSHILFANDLCLLSHLGSLAPTVTHFRIEGQHYTSEQVALITALYRHELDKIAKEREQYHFDHSLLNKLTAISPRELGIGVYRYRISR